MSTGPVNCGRCAHLWNRYPNTPGFGRCASQARQAQTGQIRPLVDLNSSCEHAQLSAKFDPDFLPNLNAARRGDWPFPSLLPPDPEPPAIQSHASKNESAQEIRQDLFQD